MEVIFIDPLFVVINKPSGLLSVPGKGPELQECVANRIKALFPEGIDQPGRIHPHDRTHPSAPPARRPFPGDRHTHRRRPALWQRQKARRTIASCHLSGLSAPGLRPEDELPLRHSPFKEYTSQMATDNAPTTSKPPLPDHPQPSPNSYQSDWTYTINSNNMKQAPYKIPKRPCDKLMANDSRVSHSLFFPFMVCRTTNKSFTKSSVAT